MVFNRWGNKIYSSDDYKNDWKPNVTDGTYFYIINVTDGRKFNGYFQVFKIKNDPNFKSIFCLFFCFAN